MPLQRQDAAFGLGALKRRPYIYSKSEEAGEAWRGHGCAVPLQRQDAAFGLGALKRRPYIYSKSEEAGEARRGHGCAVPLLRKDAAFGLLRSGMAEKSDGLQR